MSQNKLQVNTITEGNLLPVISRLAWPSVFSQVLFLFPTLYDAIWLGTLGPEAQSAAGLATAVRITMISVLMALSGATGSVVSRYLGANDREKADAATFNGILLMILASGTLGLIGLSLNRTLMELAGADEIVLPMAVRYARILFSGLIAMELVPSMGGVFTASGVPQLRLSMMFWTVGTMAIAEPLLVGWLGLEGAVLALVGAHTVGMLWGLGKLVQGKYLIRINIRQLNINPGVMGKILRITGPAIVQRGFPNLGMVILMRLIAFYGAPTLAAWVIIRNIFSFALLIGQGISGLSGAMVGQNLGAQQPERAKLAVQTLTRIVFSITAVVLTITVIFAPQIISIFSSDTQTRAISVLMIRIMAIGYLGQTISWIFDSALVGAGDTITPMLIYASVWTGQLLLAYFLSVTVNYGTIGLWIALNIGWWLQTLLLWLKFKQGKWQLRTL